MNSLTGGNKNKAGAIDVSPETIEYMGGFAGSGVGRLATQGYRLVEKALTGEDVSAKDVPILRTFVGSKDINAQRSVFFDNLERIKIEHNQVQDRETASFADRRLAALYSGGNIAQKRVKNLLDHGQEDAARAVMSTFNKRVKQVMQ
jgi:hypothetical protein